MGCASSPKLGLFLQTDLGLVLPLTVGGVLRTDPWLGSMVVVVKAVKGRALCCGSACSHARAERLQVLVLHRKQKSFPTLLGPLDTFCWDGESKRKHVDLILFKFILWCS